MISEAEEHQSKADLPTVVADVLAMGAMTALMKDNGGIRGIVTGDSFRSGVARTMAQQCSLKFERACMPFQYALSTRAGTDCVARVVRSLMELDPIRPHHTEGNAGGPPHQPRAGAIAPVCQALLWQGFHVRVV